MLGYALGRRAAARSAQARTAARRASHTNANSRIACRGSAIRPEPGEVVAMTRPAPREFAALPRAVRLASYRASQTFRRIQCARLWVPAQRPAIAPSPAPNPCAAADLRAMPGLPGIRLQAAH